MSSCPPLYLLKMFLYIGVWDGREEGSGGDWLVLIATLRSSYLEVVRTGQLVRLRTEETQVEWSTVQLLETPGEHRGGEG